MNQYASSNEKMRFYTFIKQCDDIYMPFYLRMPIVFDFPQCSLSYVHIKDLPQVLTMILDLIFDYMMGVLHSLKFRFRTFWM